MYSEKFKNEKIRKRPEPVLVPDAVEIPIARFVEYSDTSLFISEKDLRAAGWERKEPE